MQNFREILEGSLYRDILKTEFLLLYVKSRITSYKNTMKQRKRFLQTVFDALEISGSGHLKFKQSISLRIFMVSQF